VEVGPENDWLWRIGQGNRAKALCFHSHANDSSAKSSWKFGVENAKAGSTTKTAKTMNLHDKSGYPG
jgi:hypothetical protein